MQFHLGYVTETIWNHNFYLPLVCHLTSDLKVFTVYTRRSNRNEKIKSKMVAYNLHIQTIGCIHLKYELLPFLLVKSFNLLGIPSVGLQHNQYHISVLLWMGKRYQAEYKLLLLQDQRSCLIHAIYFFQWSVGNHRGFSNYRIT